MKEIVTYSNDLNKKLIFKDFSPLELNVFMSLCARAKGQGIQSICFTFTELKKMADCTYLTNKELEEKLIVMNEKLSKLTWDIRIGNESVMFVLFTTFRINEDENTLRISVNSDFAYLINNFSREFTRFELEEFTSLQSKYAKHLYRLLMQYKQTGKFFITALDLRERMDCPIKYSNTVFNAKCVKVAVEEINKRCPTMDLEYEPVYGDTKGNPLLSFNFTFVPTEKRENLITEGDLSDEN